MGVLFISHSSRDNDAAIRIRDWLKENGWGEVFLDLDPELGIVPGRVWQQELKLAGERCAGVLVLLSPNWLNSRWCRTEFLVADQLGKKIFPVFIVGQSANGFRGLHIFLTGNLDDTTQRTVEPFKPVALIGKPILPELLRRALQTAERHS